jgi:hypothetical protein
MNEVLINSMIDKVDAHEKKISELKEKADNLPDYTELLSQVKGAIESIQTNVQKVDFPQKEIQQLTASLVITSSLLKQPVKQEVIHHHHVPKVIWIAAGLFLVLCFVLTGWYKTAGKLEMYKANDTRYRYLKLESDTALNKWLRFTDSLYLASTKMREVVIAREEENQRQLEMLQRALQLEDEAKKLKQQANEKKDKR